MARTSSAHITVLLASILVAAGSFATIRLIGRVPLPFTYASVAGLIVFAALAAVCWRSKRWGFYGMILMGLLVLAVNLTTPAHNVFILQWADPVDSSLLLLTGYVLPTLLVAFSAVWQIKNPRKVTTRVQ